MASVSLNISHNIMSFFSVSLVSLLKNLIIFLIFTFTIATITLIERKILALVQRRVGRNYIGYKGRLQFIADALKMLLKHILIVSKLNKGIFIAVPALILMISYLFWANLVWSPNLAICEIEYNVLFLCITSTSFSYFTIAVGCLSNSKYAVMSSLRVIILGVVVEILLTFWLILLAIMTEELTFVNMITVQHKCGLNILFFLPIFPVIVITFFAETARIPFDLTEAESELVAGYTTEFGGFYFALFYLGEYFHLFCFSTAYAIVLTGGWN